MRIVGIDPGSNATGYGVVAREGGGVRHVAHGTLRPPRGATLSLRLSQIQRGLHEAIEAHRPDLAVVERVFVSHNPRAALVLGQARGAALAALGAHGLPVQEVAPREIKLAVTGSGAAGKRQVQEMVSRLLGLQSTPASDAADALAAAICQAHQGGLTGLDARRRGRGARWSARDLRSLSR